MSSNDHKKFTTQDKVKQANVESVSDVMVLPSDTTDYILTVTDGKSEPIITTSTELGVAVPEQTNAIRISTIHGPEQYSSWFETTDTVFESHDFSDGLSLFHASSVGYYHAILDAMEAIKVEFTDGSYVKIAKSWNNNLKLEYRDKTNGAVKSFVAGGTTDINNISGSFIGYDMSLSRYFKAAISFGPIEGYKATAINDDINTANTVTTSSLTAENGADWDELDFSNKVHSKTMFYRGYANSGSNTTFTDLDVLGVAAKEIYFGTMSPCTHDENDQVRAGGTTGIKDMFSKDYDRMFLFGDGDSDETSPNIVIKSHGDNGAVTLNYKSEYFTGGSTTQVLSVRNTPPAQFISSADTVDRELIDIQRTGGSSISGNIDVEVEMSPDGENWCAALNREATTQTSAAPAAEGQGNEEGVILIPTEDQQKSKFALGSLSYNADGTPTTYDQLDGSQNYRDALHQHMQVDKPFNFSWWHKTTADNPPSDTHTPVLWRHGGKDTYTNEKAVALTDIGAPPGAENTSYMLRTNNTLANSELWLQNGNGGLTSTVSFYGNQGTKNNISGTRDFTTTCWVYLDSAAISAGPVKFLCASMADSTGTQFMIGIESVNTTTFKTWSYFSPSGFSGITAGTNVSTNVSFSDGWYLFTLSNDASNNTLHYRMINEAGQLFWNTTKTYTSAYDFDASFASGNTFGSGAQYLTIGLQSARGTTNIVYDEYGTYDTFLSTTDLQKLTNGTTAVHPLNAGLSPTSYFRFGDVSGDAVTGGSFGGALVNCDIGSGSQMQSYKNSGFSLFTYDTITYPQHAFMNYTPTGNKVTQNLCDGLASVPLTYNAAIKTGPSNTLSEFTTDGSANDIRYATNNVRNWTTVTFHPSTTEFTSNANIQIGHISGSSATLRNYGVLVGGQANYPDRLVVRPFYGLCQNVGSTAPAYAILGNTYYSSPITTTYLSGAALDSYLNNGMMSIAVNEFDVSTLTRSVTVYIYSTDGTLLFSNTYSRVHTQDQYDFFNGTHTTTNYTGIPFVNDSTWSGVYTPNSTSFQVLNQATSSQDISTLFNTNADGSFAFKDLSSNSNCIVQLRGGNGANDTPTATPPVLDNEATTITTFPSQVTAADVSENATYAYPTGGLSELKPASNSLFSTSSNLSISGWFKTTLDDQGVLFSNTEGAAVSGIKLDVNSSDMTINFIATSAENITVNSDVNDGEWHHLVITKNDAGVNQFTVYVDGSQVVQDTAAITDTDLKGSNGFTLLGDGQNNANNLSAADNDNSKLNASLSNWSIHSEVLSADAVSYIYNRGKVRNIRTIPDSASGGVLNTTAIEGYWKLSDTTSPEQDSIGSKNLQYQDGNSPAQTLLDNQVDTTGDMLHKETDQYGSGLTVSLTKRFNFDTSEWGSTSDQDTALCLSFNGFEDHAEYFVLYKCSQGTGENILDICNNDWNNVIISFSGNEGGTITDMVEGDLAIFSSSDYNFTVSYNGQNLASFASAADFVGGMGLNASNATKSFPLYNRHLKFVGTQDEIYIPHCQFNSNIFVPVDNATNRHIPQDIDSITSFQGYVDESSFHSESWWVNALGADQTTFSQEKVGTMYGNTTALDNRGANSNVYGVGKPYPLLNPDVIGATRNTSQWINPYPIGVTQEDGNVSTGGLEGFWRWGDISGDCSENINDAIGDQEDPKDRHRSLKARNFEATEVVGATQDIISLTTSDSIYISESAVVSAIFQYNPITIEGISSAICNIKNFVSPVLQYVRIKFTGDGSCKLGDKDIKAAIHFRKRRKK